MLAVADTNPPVKTLPPVMLAVTLTVVPVWLVAFTLPNIALPVALTIPAVMILPPVMLAVALIRPPVNKLPLVTFPPTITAPASVTVR